MRIPKIFDFNNDGDVGYREACEAVDALDYTSDEVVMLTGQTEYHFLGDGDDERQLTIYSDDSISDIYDED